MTTNAFEEAINSNELNAFFRGEGKYHIPSRDYNGHMHGAQMGGAARSYAEQSSSHTNDFDKGFLNFIESLDVSCEDLNHLLANMSSYFGQKSRNGFPDSILFDNASSLGSLLVIDYLKKIDQASFANEVKDQVLRHAKFINNKGSSLLNDILIELPNIK